MLQRLCVLALLIFPVILSGCGLFGDDEATSPKAPMQSEDCEEVYTFAPANFVIHMASGEQIMLDPMSGDYPVYCDAKSAKQGLRQAIEDKMVEDGDWKIYRMEGEWQALATEAQPGFYLLKTKAQLIDWVND